MDLNLLRVDEIKINGKAVPVYVYKYNAHRKARLPKCKSKITLKKGKYEKKLLELYCGFDIETTNIIKDNKKLAFMYIWQFIIATEDIGFCYLGRTWDDFVVLLGEIADFYKTSPQNKIIIWDANFGFEFQFLRKHIEWEEDEFSFFAKELRKPLLATCYGGIEFRDCLAISGGSLGQLAKDFCFTQKLKGDLDYSIPRNSHTELTREELSYCINDVKILAEFSFFAMQTWIRPNKKIPLTKTGILRGETKREYQKKCKNKRAYEAMIMAAYPDGDTYKKWFKYLFRGGFVHANFFYTNEIICNALMYDITSSYPAQMLLNYYPETPFIDDVFSEENLQTKCCIMEVRFYDIEATTYHSIESKHKLIDSAGVKLDNGRVWRADMVHVMLTELDYDNYRKFYRWDESKTEILSFKTAKRGKLPPFITNVLLRHYFTKAELKQQGLSGTPEYALKKSGVNSCFGLMCTRLSLDKVEYHGNDWAIQEHAINFDEESEKQILLPQHGIYVAAHGRHELLKCVKMIEDAIPNSVIYCDTDSIKCRNDERIAAIIDEYNEGIRKKLKAAGLTHPLLADLGMFDLEYKKPVDRIKTLGAKRYIYEVNGKVNCTIAGLPKDVLPKLEGDPFENFDMDGLVVPLEYSEKLTSAYNDEETSAVICGEEMHELSSVALYQIPFSLFTKLDYYNMVAAEKEKKEERKYYNDL